MDRIAGLGHHDSHYEAMAPVQWMSLIISELTVGSADRRLGLLTGGLEADGSARIFTGVWASSRRTERNGKLLNA